VTRVAVCDLGTNSTRLLVADVENGSLVDIERRLEITRLGEGVDASGSLASGAIARVEAVLAEYATSADELDVERRVAVGTSAVRDAGNGGTFLADVEERFGFPVRLLDGDEEAMLTFRGVAAGLTLREPALVVDLGGGSTELVVGDDASVSFRASLDLGCVRLSERYLRAEPPVVEQSRELRAAVRLLLEQVVPPSVRPRRAIGVAGTVTTLATLYAGLDEEDPVLLHGHALPAGWIESEAIRLSATPQAELLARPGISAGRAPVIAGGALALAEIVAFFDLDELEVSERDILHGAALELAA